MEKEERFRMVERIIELRLTPLQQQILHMKEYEGKKYNEIADILGMHNRQYACNFREQEKKSENVT